MALQTSGAISLADIQLEFGGSNPISLSEYYGAASGIPSSGSIDFADFYGKSAAPTANTGGQYIDTASPLIFQVNTTTDTIVFTDAQTVPCLPLKGSAPAVWYVASTNGSYFYKCIGWGTTFLGKGSAENLIFERLLGAPLPTGASGYFDATYELDFVAGQQTGRWSSPAAIESALAPHSSKYFALKSMTKDGLVQNTIPLGCINYLVHNSHFTFNT